MNEKNKKQIQEKKKAEETRIAKQEKILARKKQLKRFLKRIMQGVDLRSRLKRAYYLV